MKQIKLLFIVLAFFTGTVNAQWTRLEAQINNVGTLTPNIDGVATDSIWKIVPINNIERLFENDSTKWDPILPIDEDMSGYWQAAWSDEGLYILIVTLSDDTIPVLGAHGFSWEQERLQIYLDMGIDNLENGKGNVDEGAIHLLVDVTRYATAVIPIDGFAGSSMAISVHPDYSGVAEFFVPWSALKTRAGVAYIPSAIEPIGFEVILVDNDGPENPPLRNRRLWCAIDDPYFNCDNIGRITFLGGIDTLQLSKPYELEEINVENFQIVGYLPTYRWSAINNIDFRGLTQVNMSFANPSANGTLSFGANIGQLKTALEGLNAKINISIGGGAVDATVAGYYTNLLKDENRAAFIEKIIDFIAVNEIDGLDIDLEGSLVEIPEYNAFVKEVTTALHAVGKIVTVTIPNWSGSLITDDTYNAIDWINIMSYDATGPWAPTRPGQHAPYSKYLSDFDYFNSSRAIHGSKIIMGVPFYGYEFASTTQANTYTYAEIIKKYPGAELLDEVNENLYYNGKPTIIKKTEFAKKYAGGILMWELGQDSYDEHSLLWAIYTTAELGLTPLSVNTKTNNAIIECYPNPFSEKLVIKAPNDFSSGKAEVFNILGKQVFSKTLTSNNNTIDLTSLNSGLYIVQLNIDGKRFSYKAIKK